MKLKNDLLKKQKQNKTCHTDDIFCPETVNSTRRLRNIGLPDCRQCHRHSSLATFVVTLLGSSRCSCPKRHEFIVVEEPPTSAVPRSRSHSWCQRVEENGKLETRKWNSSRFNLSGNLNLNVCCFFFFLYTS